MKSPTPQRLKRCEVAFNAWHQLSELEQNIRLDKIAFSKLNGTVHLDVERHITNLSRKENAIDIESATPVVLEKHL